MSWLCTGEMPSTEFSCNSYLAGDSSWIDFFNPEVRDWWASKFALDQYKGSTPTLSVWNDMNEVRVCKFYYLGLNHYCLLLSLHLPLL